MRFHGHRWRCGVISMALVWGLTAHTARAAPVAEALPNPGFEEPVLGWTLWPADSATTAAAEPGVAHSGRQALHLRATASDDRLFPNAAAKGLQDGAIYRVVFFVRRSPSVPREAVTVHWNIRVTDPKAPAQRLHPMMPEWQTEGEWERFSGLFQLPAAVASVQFCLGLQNAAGDVWIDDVGIEPAGGDAALKSSLWRTVSIGVEIGAEPQKRYSAHKAANDAVYQASSAYNRLVFREAFAEDALRQVARRHFYAGRPEAAGPLAAAVPAMENALAAAYDAYAAAFRSGAETDWRAFRTQLARLEQACAAAEGTAAAAAGAPLPASDLPAHLGRQDRAVPPFGPGGRLNRLLFGAWSPLEFREQEAPFDFEFHSSVPGNPPDESRETADFGFVKEACDRLEAQGYRGSFGYLMFGVHDKLYAPPWLLAQYPGEPGLLRVSWDGLAAQREPGNVQRLDYFHPAVAQFIDRYLARYAAACRSEPRVLFHETSQEAYPDFTATGGVLRENGYGPHALAAFRTWLQSQYRTIAELNAAWGTTYADFAVIEPPPDAYAKPDRPQDALTAEFERFRENAYMDYLARLYRALKQGDPDRPVAARHSSLLRSINGARVFETCDVLSCHARAPQMGLMTVYANSLSRVHGKSLGYLEDFWGTQELANRPWDERAQRAGLQAHVQRMAIWGRVLQMKWYAYTAGSYLFTYNGNWFDPRYDVTTLRYCAPGLAVAKRAMERVDWILTHSRIVPAKVLVLQPSTAMRIGLPSRRAYSAILDLHGLLQGNGVPYELLPEEYIEDGRTSLADFTVICLPEADCLSPNLQQKLAAFLTGGGTVIAVGQPGTRDHLARPSRELLRTVRAGLPADQQARLDTGWTDPAAAMQSISAGRGLLLAVPGSQALLTPAGKEEVLGTVRERAPAPVWSRERRLEVVLRVAEDGGRYLFILNPDPDAAREDFVCLRQAPTAVTDISLAGGARVPVASIDGTPALRLRLFPGESAVLWVR